MVGGNERYVNNADQERCRRCNRFVSKDTSNERIVRYYCKYCDEWVLEWLNNSANATSD